MKKLTITLAAIGIAIASQAAVAQWKVTGGNMYAGNSTTKYVGTAYVFDVATLAQTALYDAFSKNTSYDFAANSAGSVSVANGAVVTTSNSNIFEYGDPTGTYSFYFVLLSDDKESIYFSNTLTDKNGLNPPSVQQLSFASQNNGTTTFSATAAADGFQGAGKWSSVPEPTSGLLMLLGFAGLALRRKQK